MIQFVNMELPLLEERRRKGQIFCRDEMRTRRRRRREEEGGDRGGGAMILEGLHDFVEKRLFT